MTNFIKFVFAAGIMSTLTGFSLFGGDYNGFDVKRRSVPLEEILGGGPARDGIPALFKPEFVSAVEAGKNFLRPGDRVLGIALAGQARAYPVRILNWHEIVNDVVAGQPVAVTFCSLCGTGMVFDARVKGRRLTFGVSGLLYQSDVLLYDRQTESLWSQIKSEAVTGEMLGSKLKLLPTAHTTWKKWRDKHPETLVLSTDTGHRRNYDRDPYKDYYSSRQLMFGVGRQNDLYHPKEKVIGIAFGKEAKAWPFSELARTKGTVKDSLGGKKLIVSYDATSKSAAVHDTNGKELPSVTGFWFAWYAFHPTTEVFRIGNLK